MKKLLYLITILIQVLLMFGSELFQKYARSRMGMHRWVSYYNRHIESSYPVSTIKTSLLVILVLFTIIAIIIFIKSIYLNNSGILQKLMCISAAIINSILMYFILVNNSISNTSYYFVILIIGAISLIQFIKLIIYTNINKKSKIIS